MKDKKKMEKKESKIREALLSIFERGRLDNKDDYDEKLKRALCDKEPSVMGAALCLYKDVVKNNPT